MKQLRPYLNTVIEINLHQLFGHYKVVKNNTFEQSPHFEQAKTFKSLCSCSEIKLVLNIIYLGAPERLFIIGLVILC